MCINYCYMLNSVSNGFYLFIPAFKENLIIIANPSKSGGDWWYGTISSNSSKSGLFPKTYVEIVNPSMSTYHLLSAGVLILFQEKPKPSTNMPAIIPMNSLLRKARYFRL